MRILIGFRSHERKGKRHEPEILSLRTKRGRGGIGSRLSKNRRSERVWSATHKKGRENSDKEGRGREEKSSIPVFSDRSEIGCYIMDRVAIGGGERKER